MRKVIVLLVIVVVAKVFTPVNVWSLARKAKLVEAEMVRKVLDAFAG